MAYPVSVEKDERTIWEFTPKQWSVMEDITSDEISAVGGVGSGKTFLLTRWAIHRSLVNPPSVMGLVVEPTLRQVKRVLVPEFRHAFESAGIPYTLNQSDYTLTWGPREERRTIWLASGEIPENLSGTTVGFAAMDEFALLDEEVYRRVTARVRDQKATLLQKLYVGTPEGLNWAHDLSLRCKRVIMPTASNPFQPASYLRQLRKTFADPLRWKMYVEGEAVQLAGGIYTNFSERHCRSCENPRAGELAIGMDFNVAFMCTPIARCLGDEVHVIGEVVSAQTDTEKHIQRVKEYLITNGLAHMGREAGGFDDRMIGNNNHAIEAHLDASSVARKTSSTRSDRDIVRAAGFWPRHDSSNPPVRDRIARMQYGFAHDKIFIDPVAAPVTCDSLRKHSYRKGSNPPEPQKAWRDGDIPYDAACDGLGYMVYNNVRLTHGVRVG